MEVKTISTTFHVANIEELSEEDRMLVEKAISQTEISYAPYSHFHVGAAAIRKTQHLASACAPSGQPSLPPEPTIQTWLSIQWQ